MILFAIVFFSCVAASAQTCPAKDGPDVGSAAKPSELRGTLRYHDELREWLGIQFDQPVCGQKEIQIIFTTSDDWRMAKADRGCVVTIIGELYDSPTGYYSTDMAMQDPKLKLDSSCRPFPIDPDLDAVAMAPGTKTYHASITVDYRGKGHIDVKVWKDDEKSATLTPWQSYVGYSLTGGQDVIWFGCHEGFGIAEISQTPLNPQGIFNDEPNGTGTLLQDMKGTNVIKFTCEKKSKDVEAKKKSPRRSNK